MSKQPRTITQFVRDKRRVGCPVCKIPAPIRAQMVEARRRSRITVATIVEWLKSEHGISITREQFRLHYGGLHEGTKTMRTK